MIVTLPQHFTPWLNGLTRFTEPSPASRMMQWHLRLDWPNMFTYHALVEEMAFIIWPDRDMPYYFQGEPNLRIQPPDSECVPWHSDADFGHLAAEWNVWIPLTHIFDVSQMLWVEEGPWGRLPVEVKLGQAYIFPGAQWQHGNKMNTTEVERRSFDFRLIAQHDFVDQKILTHRYAVPLSLGEYWRTP